MEGINYFALCQFRIALLEEDITILHECTDRISYMFIIEDSFISPSVLAKLCRVFSCGMQMIEYDGLDRLCFYILRRSSNT